MNRKTIKGLNLELANAGIDLKNAGIREDDLAKHITRLSKDKKIIPHPQLEGSFEFDFATGLAKVDQNQKIIWGFPDNIVSLDTVMSLVTHNHRDQLIESVLEKKIITETPIIELKNGNKIQEIFSKSFNGGKNGGYEFETIEGIEGVTRLVA